MRCGAVSGRSSEINAVYVGVVSKPAGESMKAHPPCAEGLGLSFVKNEQPVLRLPNLRVFGGGCVWWWLMWSEDGTRFVARHELSCVLGEGAFGIGRALAICLSVITRRESKLKTFIFLLFPRWARFSLPGGGRNPVFRYSFG